MCMCAERTILNNFHERATKLIIGFSQSRYYCIDDEIYLLITTRSGQLTMAKRNETRKNKHVENGFVIDLSSLTSGSYFKGFFSLFHEALSMMSEWRRKKWVKRIGTMEIWIMWMYIATMKGNWRLKWITELLLLIWKRNPNKRWNRELRTKWKNVELFFLSLFSLRKIEKM